jgi:hypothetical protein
MSKKQLRISPFKIRQKAKELEGDYATVIKKDNATYLMKIRQVKEKHLEAEDMRMQKHIFPFTDLTEIIVEVKVD